MPRPRGFDIDVALERALETFWRHGFAATSLPALLDAMEIGRSSFYETFGGKRELFEAVLDQYEARVTAQVLTAVERPGPIRGVLRDLAQDLVERALSDGGKGCLVGNTSVELGPHDLELRAWVARSMTRVETALETRLSVAQQDGDLDAGADTRQIARTMVATFHGLRIVAKARPDRAILEDIAGGVVALLDAPATRAPEAMRVDDEVPTGATLA
ncbi:helix-turn-helix transcriptional regulator [Roseospira marina]|uniref:Helix-turn-helix transcriptional regulator n=1 Tax=Roseospira marina TaxID=140057 RepID=A0A5M6I9E0_9PROT|nr:TetR/AcrR family transcriptional regulator [Roseospira marina]KAA5604792.1 helix-turn-helix transcriptional regulator [Roseospira marina]MBB4313481.1 TetR/AcrR family transcriptional repressor of nem operon [Roseospira marina]MBB5086643.1 TetR/AcrR family transcriptional repressor of nem operon [Roseospira marina]